MLEVNGHFVNLDYEDEREVAGERYLFNLTISFIDVIISGNI